MLLERLRETFDTDDTIVSAFSDAEASNASPQERYHLWADESGWTRRAPEYLLPRVVRHIQREWPPFAGQQRGHLDLSRRELASRIRELGPWSVPYHLGHRLSTMPTDLVGRVAESRILFRRELIAGTVAALLGGDIARTSVLDLGCSSGFFSLDLAARGAERVDGVDLRHQNVAQARFLAVHYGIDNAHFEVGDASDFQLGRQWDVVLNLGVLYHVTQPLRLIRRTYERCREFAVIDTICHREPVSAYFLMGEKDVGRLTEGRETVEFHPTYRAVIDTIRYAGFSEVVELVGTADRPHQLYATGKRRCFLAVK
jgi:tRNA (mo5U34)-methyltransferase